MMKKTLIAGVILAASTGLAFANGGTYTPPAHAGSFYVGAGASRDFVNYDTPNYFRWGSYGNKMIDYGDSGWNGDLFAGYGMTFQDHYYFAGEVFGSISDNNVKRHCTQLMLDWSYGVAVMPGVKISDSTMFYGRLAWIRSRFEQKSGGISVNTNKSGIQLGVGMETMMCHNVSLRGEYDWNRYSKMMGIRPTVDQYKLSAVYHFTV